MEHITIEEAIKRTGLTERTIRRYVAKFRATPHVKHRGRKILISTQALNLTSPSGSTQQSQDNTPLVEALQNHISDLQKELDKLHDKYDRLQRADAEKQNELNHVHRRLTEIVEKRKSKTVSMQIVPDNINAEDIQSEDLPKDFTERTFSDWLSQMKQG